MRALIVLGLMLLGGAAGMIGDPAQAQPYGYYRGYGDYGYRYDPPRLYGPDGSYTPFIYPNGYDGYNEPPERPRAAGFQGIPHDDYGPNPNGMVGPDGRRIECKLTDRYDSYYGRYVRRRECW